MSSLSSSALELSSSGSFVSASTGLATNTSSPASKESTSSFLLGGTDNIFDSWYEPSSDSIIENSALEASTRSRASSRLSHPKNIYTFSESGLILKVRVLLDDLASGKITPETLAAAVFGYAPNKKSDLCYQRGLELYSLVEISLDMLSKGQFAYQRDIYYRNKALFKSTENVRLLCCKLAFYLDIPPTQLNILPCPKGRMYGNLSLELTDGCVLDYSNPCTHAIPHARFVHRIRLHCHMRQVLVVEKETAFFALIQCGFGRRFPWVVLVTGKGYPDVNTREVIGMFAIDVPVAVLVDYDPDGAQIYRVYAEGGLKGDALILPHARWVGLHCSCGRIGKWGLDPDSMVEFSARDRRISLHLIKGWEKSAELRRKMAKMLYRGKKVELEAITQFRGMLLDYINHILLADCD